MAVKSKKNSLLNGRGLNPKGSLPNKTPVRTLVELRTVEVARKFTEGYSSDEIIDWLVATYNLSDYSAYQELRKVYKLFKERTQEEIDVLHKRISSMYLSLYRKAIENDDSLLALKTLELYSNFATNKDIININIVNDTQVNLSLDSYSDEDLEKLINGDSVQIIEAKND